MADPRRKHVLFGIAVLVQLLLLVAVPGQKVEARFTGRTILLKTEPVDPYDILSGYYLTLAYPVARTSAYPEGLPPGVDVGDTVYALLRVGPDGVAETLGLRSARPSSLPGDQVFLRGELTERRRIRFGIESFFIPEERRSEMEGILRRERDRVLVEVRVDGRGRAALIGLRIGERAYRF
jgi:uncharacterized membrane-anchored protein